MKQQIRTILRRFDIDVRRLSHRPTLMSYLMDRRIDLVLDVGANEGQFAKQLRAEGYKGRICSFEPVSAVAAMLRATAQTDPDWEVKPFALGAESRRATIHVAEFSVFSSILPQTTAAAQYDTRSATQRTEEIEVRTLDDVMPSLPERTFLKIDTQGFERQVLEGAKKTLPQLKGVIMELPIIHLYQNSWPFHEAVGFMRQAGFVPAQFHPVNFHGRDTVSLVEVDCLFRPYDPAIDAPMELAAADAAPPGSPATDAARH